MSKVFSIPIRVYYEDTDAGNMDFEQDELSRRDGIIFAVRSVRLDFRKPARFNDLLQASVEIAKCGNASITFMQQIRRARLTLCEGEVKVACLETATFVPCAIPERVRARLDTGGAA